MPFTNQIIQFINDEMKASSLNKEKLQPAKFHLLSSVIARSSKGTAQNQIELLPAATDANGKINYITPDSKIALQIYHKINSKSYSYEKNSYGDNNFLKSVSNLLLVVLNNIAITGKTNNVIEPEIILGMPQRLSADLLTNLKLSKCTITPVISNLNQIEVFRQEYPQSNYFLNEKMSMFSILYRLEVVYKKECIEQCSCN